MPRNSPISRRSFLASCAALTATQLAPSRGLAPNIDPDWTTQLPPFRIAGNLFYVGSRDLASYLVTTDMGHILINSNLVTSPPQIRASVEQLGFEWRQVKILLISHAHYDHCAGSAQILKETGAQYLVMDADVEDIQTGGKTNFFYANRPEFRYQPAKVTRKLHDGDQVQLGKTTLTAHKTAGHTKGCTTWTLETAVIPGRAEQSYKAVIIGSPYVLPGYNLLDDSKYPQMAADFRQQFATLKSLPCDLFLGAHGGYFNLLEKYTRMKSDSATNPFLDPKGYQDFINERQQAFETELARQKKAHLKG
jgi:metallo-beta-lactamase class B